ncbi:MAG: phosphatase PAP2 family protein [Rhizomicrobium sp.]
MVALVEATRTDAGAFPDSEPSGMPVILVGVAGAVALADVCWAASGRFDIDVAAYARLGALSVLLWLGSLFYARIRKSPDLAAMLFGAGFLVAFAAGFSVLNYFLLTVAGHRIDTVLAQIDRALGVDWPALMAFVAAHPALNLLLRLAYITVLPQVALLIIALGFCGRANAIYEFCLALAIAAAITIAFWTVFPSFGAFSIYVLPGEVVHRLHPELGPAYARDLVALLASGPGRISPDQIKGLIGFPSFHAAMAVLVVWYGRRLRYLRWPLVAWNIVVLVATPVHGGHFVVDVIAGLAVVAPAILLTRRIALARRRTVQSAAWYPIGIEPPESSVGDAIDTGRLEPAA